MRWQRVITVVDAHAEGEIGRVITGGVIGVPGATMFDKKRHLETEGDGLRRFLLHEPRGHVCASVNLILPPTRPEADAGFIVMESTDYPPMSGSNTMCVVTVLLETGMLPMTEPVTKLVLDTPGGLVPVEAACRDGKCESVRFVNVPAFVARLDAPVEVAGLGTVTCDVSYGGAFFCIVDARALGFALKPDEARDLVAVGERIKRAAVGQVPVTHPANPAIRDITFTLFAGAYEKGKPSRNTVIVSPGRHDRSPCGTGTTARLAVLHARGLIGAGEVFAHESLLGTRFYGEIVGEGAIGQTPTLDIAISGRAWISALHQFGHDPADPFPEGYRLNDTWPDPQAPAR